MIVPVFSVQGDLWVPLGKRSEKVSDSGKWCLPCGYLDYDESGQEAAIREAHEEMGLDLRGLIPDQPWYVQSDPTKDERQNVTLRYGFVADVPELPELTIDHSEMIASEWRGTGSAIASTNLAFNHAKIICDFLKSYPQAYAIEPGSGEHHTSPGHMSKRVWGAGETDKDRIRLWESVTTCRSDWSHTGGNFLD